MSVCSDLVTKSEFDDLKKLVNQKIDKSEEDRIIQSSVGIAVPLGIAGAVGQLSPSIDEALSKAGKAFTNTAKNAGKIVKNVGSIAANAANIFGLVADIVALAIVFKHETVDLPQIRQSIKLQQTQIDLNFSIAIANKKKLFEQDKTIAKQQKEIAANQRTLIANTSLILDNKAVIKQNKEQIAINETVTIDNALKITRVEREYKEDIQATADILRSEYNQADLTTQAKVDNQIKGIQQEFNGEIARIETKFGIQQAIQDRQLTEADAVIAGLKNNITGVRQDIKNVITTKANASELVTIKRRVANNTTTASTALRTAKLASSSGGSSLSSTEKNSLLDAIAKLQLKDAALTKDINTIKDTTLNSEQTKTFREELAKDYKAVLATAGVLATPALLNQINTNTSPTAIVSATQTGICNSTSSGGCLNSNVRNPLAQKMDDILTAFNTTASAGNTALNTQILARVTNIQSVVNSSTNGLAAINNFMRNAWQNTKLDKVLNVLNTVLALHNALMLSRNLGQTLGDVATSALQFLNIKDAENNSIDVNEFIGSTVNNWITNLVGAQTYANIQTTWISLNRIMVAAQGMVSAVQGVKNAVLESMETVGGWTAKIGNNMQIQGLLEERSFPWMNENINFRNPFSKWMQKIDVTEEVLSQVNNLVSSGIEAQENFTELINNSNELTTASQELQANLAQFDLDKEVAETEETTISASPNIDRLDLIQLELDEIEGSE